MKFTKPGPAIDARCLWPSHIRILMLGITMTVLGARASSAAGTGADSSTSGSLDEIIVTAEKRNASVQSAPLSITALKGSDLTEAGITNLTDVAEEVPGVSFKTGGPGQTEFEMRGLNSAGGNSATVGFYLDDTPLSAFAFSEAGKVVIDPDLYDLNRVEVLRGPQGTLYGAGSMGGTIRLITNQPILNEYHASAQLVGSETEGGGGNIGGSGMVNLPLVDDAVALRIVGTDKTTAGWISRIVEDPFPLPTNGGLTRGNLSAPITQVIADTNWERLKGARATLLIKPTESLSITPMIMFQEIRMGGQSLIDNPPGDVEAHYEPFDSPEPVEDRFLLFGLNVTYDFDGFQVVSATSRWNRSLTQVQDGSEVLQDVLALPSYYVSQGGLGNNPWTEQDTANLTSEELRIASTNHSSFQWQGGLFYGDLTSTTVQYSVDQAAGPLFGVTTLFHENVPQTFNQKAAFGEVSYQFTPSLKATAGLRYFHFDNEFSSTEYGFFGPNGNLTPGGSSSAATQSGVNPKFNLAYEPSDQLTLYGTVSKGFRPGGGNAIIPTGNTEEGQACLANLQAVGRNANPYTYNPDTVWNYELGEKIKFFDNRLSINGAVYYEKWNDIQREIVLNCGFVYTDNAGQAAVYGAELEVSARLLPELTLNVNGGYTHAAYTQDSLETGVVSGERIPDVPLVTTSQSLVYTLPIDERHTVIARLNNNYIGPRTDVNYYIDKLAGYDLTSGRIGIRDSKGWSGFFFVDNLANHHPLVNAINSLVLNIPTMTRDTTPQPRTLGIDLSYAF